MWNVSIRDKGIQNEAITVQVEFTKGEESIVRNFAGTTKEEIDNRIKQQLDLLEKRDQNVDLVSVGSWEKEPEPEVVVTVEEQERNLWLEKWREYLQGKKGMEELADAGITPTAEETARFEALKQWVAENRKIEYTQYL